VFLEEANSCLVKFVWRADHPVDVLEKVRKGEPGDLVTGLADQRELAVDEECLESLDILAVNSFEHQHSHVDLFLIQVDVHTKMPRALSRAQVPRRAGW